MTPIVLYVEGKPVYFNPVMFLADELEVNHAVIIEMGEGGKLLFFQTNEAVEVEEYQRLDEMAQFTGYPGVVHVRLVSESRITLSKPGITKELLLLKLDKNRIIGIDHVTDHGYADYKE